MKTVVLLLIIVIIFYILKSLMEIGKKTKDFEDPYE